MHTYEYWPAGSASLNHSVNKSSTNVSHLERTESASALSVLLYVTCQNAFHSSLCAYQLSLQHAKQENTPETGLKALNQCRCLSKQRVKNKKNLRLLTFHFGLEGRSLHRNVAAMTTPDHSTVFRTFACYFLSPYNKKAVVIGIQTY